MRSLWRNEDPRTYQEVGPWESPAHIRHDDLFVTDRGTKKRGPFDPVWIHRLDAHDSYQDAEDRLRALGYEVERTFTDGEGIVVNTWSREYALAELKTKGKP